MEDAVLDPPLPHAAKAKKAPVRKPRSKKENLVDSIVSNIVENVVEKLIDNVEVEEKLVENVVGEKVVINKGTGAGGANTNYFGKKFEEKTNNQTRLLEAGYVKHVLSKKADFGYYLEKKCEDRTIVFAMQNGFKTYMQHTYNIDIFRCPDEAYVITYTNGKKIVKILEKKEQNRFGSVETKLWSGPSLKREYELVLGNEFEVHYGFCVSSFLQKKLVSPQKKYIILNTIFAEHHISVLFGDESNYFERFDQWLL